MLDLIIPPWAKLAAVAVLIALSAFGGWHVRGWKEDAAKREAERAAHEKYVATVEGWAAAMQEIDKQRTAEQQQAAQDRNNWNRRLRYATRNGSKPLVDCGYGLDTSGHASYRPVAFTGDFAWLWDDALRIGLPQALRTGSDHGASAGAGIPDLEPEDLLANVAENGEACNELRSRLIAAQAWARSIGAMK